MDDVNLEILRMIQDGTISAEEGEMLLDAMDAGFEPESNLARETRAGWGGTASAAEASKPRRPAWTQQVWIYLLAGGGLLVGLAAIMTALLMVGGTLLGGLACTLPLMAFGALIIALAWWSRVARWLHVQVHDQDSRFRISLPVPLHLAAWISRVVCPWVPQMRGVPVDEMIRHLAEMDEEDILAVEVNNEGEQVQVYLG